ncbi:beta-glucosidase [Ktedonobacteria bacterium brp13]|nr:beta-glucosidase [Ktedonobacteria bacterium brp13]
MSNRNINEIAVLSSPDVELSRTFPTGFLWGAATASYQIEGAVNEDGRGVSIWDTFAATPGKILNGENGDVTIDHYHRMLADLDILSEIGLAAYRFSLAWPRILPNGSGTVNEKGLDFYDRMVDALLAKGIRPFATLYHWDLPQALQDAGGWTNRETSYRFADYAEVVARRLGDRVQDWMTLNEPWCAAYLGYGNGVHAPGIKDRQAAVNAAHHLLLGHGLAVARIRESTPATSRVGIVLNFTPAYPADDRPETIRDTAFADMFSNRWFLEPVTRGNYPAGFFEAMQLTPPLIAEGDMEIISTPIDFMGVNNYTRNVVAGSPTPVLADEVRTVNVPGAIYTEMDWEVNPQSLTDLLVRLYAEYGVQNLYVTENGSAFADQWDGGAHIHDAQRVEYLRDYLAAVSDALKRGAPLRGYFVWSLMDNYEWERGYSKRFGVVYVDYPTQRRIIKDSGRWYQSFLAEYSQEPVQ